MKLHFLLLSTLAVVLTACTEPIIREEPVMPNQIVSLGYFPLSETTLDFSPYFLFNTLVFVDEEGTEYEWRMQQPNQNNNYSYTRTYPHPSQSGFVDYKYAGGRVIFEFLCTELGAKFLVQLESDFCRDPKLDNDALPTNYVNIRGLGFNDGDVTITEPVLSIETSENQGCRGARNRGTITLIDQTYSNVRSNLQELDDERFLEVFYTPDEGLVGLRTAYMLLALKEAY